MRLKTGRRTWRKNANILNATARKTDSDNEKLENEALSKKRLQESKSKESEK